MNLNWNNGTGKKRWFSGFYVLVSLFFQAQWYDGSWSWINQHPCTKFKIRFITLVLLSKIFYFMRSMQTNIKYDHQVFLNPEPITFFYASGLLNTWIPNLLSHNVFGVFDVAQLRLSELKLKCRDEIKIKIKSIK